MYDEKKYYNISFILSAKGIAIAQDININLLKYSGDYVGDIPYWSTCTKDSNLFIKDTLIFVINSPRCDDFFGLLFHNNKIRHLYTSLH